MTSKLPAPISAHDPRLRGASRWTYLSYFVAERTASTTIPLRRTSYGICYQQVIANRRSAIYYLRYDAQPPTIDMHVVLYAFTHS